MEQTNTKPVETRQKEKKKDEKRTISAEARLRIAKMHAKFDKVIEAFRFAGIRNINRRTISELALDYALLEQNKEGFINFVKNKSTKEVKL